MSDASLFTSKAEQLVHELKEVRSVQKILRCNIERLDEIEKRYAIKVKNISDEIDKYIIALVKPEKQEP